MLSSNILVLYSLFFFGNFVYSHSSSRWDNKKSTVTLDVQNKKSTTDYIYYSLVGVSTYSASGTTVFNEVKDGDNLVWKSSNEREYSTKVELDGDKLSIKCPRLLLVFLKQDDGTWKSKDLDNAPSEEDASSVTPTKGVVSVKDVAAENHELKLKVAKLDEDLVSLKMEYDQFRSKVLSIDNRMGEVVEALGGV